MHERRIGRLGVSTIGSALVLLALACTDNTPSSPTPHSLQCEFTPPSGTSAVRGTTMAIAVKVLDMPEDVRSITLTMGVQFQRPDGVVDNSYLPGVAKAGHAESWNRPFPVTLECQFVVPTGTPEGNSFIPAGSRVLELWATLYMEHDSLRTTAGARAVYPVVG